KEVSFPLILPGDVARIDELLADLEGKTIAELVGDGLGREQIYTERTMDLRYRGQVHEIRTPVPDGRFDLAALERILQAFEAIYEQTYGEGTAFREAEVEAVVYRVTGKGLRERPPVRSYATKGEDPGQALKGRRAVCWKELDGFSPTNVYEMDLLGVGNLVEGPAIVESVDTTVVIHPGQRARLDEFRNFIIEL
ncbi:MAG TPA: hydantoinase/oxoprolinase family protein, partial [Dehalococcoidia bacterium]|nr:hydantoinase/oxoprolinase family protein [Dehalococcoidia bacterium]